MSHKKETFFTVRITPKLASDLKQVADQESNSSSAVARRILIKGLSRELHDGARDTDEQER